MVERPVYEIPVVQPGDSAAGWAPERLVPGGRRAARLEPEPAVMPDLTADLEDEPGPVAGRLWDVTDPASADPVDLGRPAAVDARAGAAAVDQTPGRRPRTKSWLIRPRVPPSTPTCWPPCTRC